MIKLVIGLKLFNYITHCMRSFLANDKEIACNGGKTFQPQAAIRQNIDLKATATKKPHFVHGVSSSLVYQAAFRCAESK